MASQSPEEAGASREYTAGWAGVNRLVREGFSWSGREANCAHVNLGDGTFADISRVAGLDHADDARAFATTDWDGDGDLDLWVVNRSAPQLRFLRNETRQPGEDGGPGFLELRLTGAGAGSGIGTGAGGEAGSNLEALGARVEVTTGDRRLLRVRQAGTGYLSQSSGRLHVGLGDGGAAGDDGPRTLEAVTVTWPDGSAQTFEDVAADRRYALTQGGALEALDEAPRGAGLAPSTPVAPTPGETARLGLSWRVAFPPLVAKTFDGREVPLATSGRPTLVNLWASYCTTCLGELKQWSARADELAAADLRVVALSVDEVSPDDADHAAIRAARKLALPFPVGLADDDLLLTCETLQSSLVDRIRDLPVPASVLLDARGRVARIYKGPIEVEQLLADVEALPLEGLDAASAALPFPGRWHGGPQFPPVLQLAERFVAADRPLLALPYLNQAYELAQRMGPGEQQARAQLARRITDAVAVLLDQGHAAEASSWLQASLGLDPRQARALELYGRGALEEGQLEAAVGAFQACLSLEPDRLGAWLGVAEAHRQRGEAEDARRAAESARELAPDDPRVTALLERLDDAVDAPADAGDG